MYNLTQDYPALTAALREALGEAVADKLDHYGIYPDGTDAVHDIPSQSFDGFIAHTNGGFRVLVPCTLRDVECEGLSDFEESTLRGYIDQSQADAADAFIYARPDLKALYDTAQHDGTDCNGDAYDWLHAYFDEREHAYARRYHSADAPELPAVPSAPRRDAETDALREEFWEVLDEWLTEGATFWYEIRAIFYAADNRRSATGEDELYIMSGINTDFEYGREGGLECAREGNYKLARLTPARVRAIVDGLASAL